MTSPSAAPPLPGPEGPARLGAGLPQQVAARSLARASAIVVWSWLATAPVVLVLGQRQYDGPLFVVVVLVMAAVTAVLSALVARRPDRLGPLTPVGLLVVAGGIAAFDGLMAEPQLPSNPAVTLLGAAALVVGLVLRPWPGLGAVVLLALWHGWCVAAGAPAADRASGYVHGLLTVATALAGGRLIAVALDRSSRQVEVHASLDRPVSTRLRLYRRAVEDGYLADDQRPAGG